MNFTLFIQRTQVFFWITVKMIINCSKSQILCLLLNWFLCLLGKVNHFQYKSWRDYWWKNRWKFAKKGKNYFLKNIFRLSPREISDAIHHKAKTGEKMPTSNAVVAGGRSGVFNSSAYNKVTVLQLAISLCLPADFYLAILFVINSSRCDFFVSVEVVSFVMTPTTTNACLLACLLDLTLQPPAPVPVVVLHLLCQLSAATAASVIVDGAQSPSSFYPSSSLNDFCFHFSYFICFNFSHSVWFTLSNPYIRLPTSLFFFLFSENCANTVAAGPLTTAQASRIGSSARFVGLPPEASSALTRPIRTCWTGGNSDVRVVLWKCSLWDHPCSRIFG